MFLGSYRVRYLQGGLKARPRIFLPLSEIVAPLVDASTCSHRVRYTPVCVFIEMHTYVNVYT